MTDVFVSYAREDRDKVEQIVSAITELGYSVWWDPEIPPGKTFSGVIDENIRAAKCVIVVWSQTSVTSNWVQEEANDGLNRGILVPILIEKTSIPRGFRMIQAADLTEWDGDTRDGEFRSIITQIRALVGDASPAGKPDETKQKEPDSKPAPAKSPAPASVKSKPADRRWSNEELERYLVGLSYDKKWKDRFDRLDSKRFGFDFNLWPVIFGPLWFLKNKFWVTTLLLLIPYAIAIGSGFGFFAYGHRFIMAGLDFFYLSYAVTYAGIALLWTLIVGGFANRYFCSMIRLKVARIRGQEVTKSTPQTRLLLLNPDSEDIIRMIVGLKYDRIWKQRFMWLSEHPKEHLPNRLAFWGGLIWLLTHGLWLKALRVTVVSLLIVGILAGIVFGGGFAAVTYIPLADKVYEMMLSPIGKLSSHFQVVEEFVVVIIVATISLLLFLYFQARAVGKKGNRWYFNSVMKRAVRHAEADNSPKTGP